MYIFKCVCVYMYICFFRFFSILGYYQCKILSIIPSVYSRFLSFTYFIYCSVYVLWKPLETFKQKSNRLWFAFSKSQMEFVVQALGSLWLFATPWTIAHQAPLFSTVSWSLLKFMSIELVMLPNYLILCPRFSFCLLSFPASWVFSNESALCIRWLKYWSFSFSISPSKEYSGLISFRIDLLVWSPCCPRDCSPRRLPSTIIWKYQFICTQPSLWSSSYIHTWLLGKP